MPKVASAVQSSVAGVTSMTGYIYDADGIRVSKGTIQKWSCDPGTAQYATTNDYVLGPGGEQFSEYTMQPNGTMKWLHTNVWVNGRVIATYEQNAKKVGGVTTLDSLLHFYLDDPLGTRRVQADYAGNVEQTCASLPFGDGESCGTFPTEHLFTGKERDSESGNDYFGARYYSSALGRFMSPDWSAKVEPVPYSKLDNPQTLNLYAYVGNNPMYGIDADGHQGPDRGNTNCASNNSSDVCKGQTTADQIKAEKQAEAQQPNNPVATAESYLAKSKAMRPVLKAFKSGHFHLSLIHDGNDRYDPNTRTVYWDPNSALETTDGGHQTPALGLGHEMAHATGNRHMTAILGNTPDPQFDFKEERRVILNYENPAARQLGESKRSDHGGNPYNVASPTSIIPEP